MRENRAALAVVGIAVGLVLAQQLMLTLVLPNISSALSATPSQAQWLLDSYPIGLAALLLPGGSLADRFGRRRMLVAGLALMSLGNLAAATAGSAQSFIAWRYVTSVGAALVFPATLSTLTSTFPAAHRSRAVAIWSISAALGGFGGIFASGALLHFWSWRSIPLASAALGILLIAPAKLCVAESSGATAPPDVRSYLTAIAGVAAVSYGIITSGSHGLASAEVFAALAGGTVLCVSFVRRQYRLSEPVLNVRALATPLAGLGMLGTTALFFAVYAAAYLCVEFLVIVEGLSPLQVGTALLSFAPLLVPLTLVSSRIATRLGVGTVVVAGLAVVAVSDLLYATLGSHGDLTRFGLACALFGGGVGLVQAPAAEAIVAALPAADQGLASALNDLTRELGAAMGIAVASAVLTANLGSEGGTTQRFMAAWPRACIAMAFACTAFVVCSALLTRRMHRPRP